MSCIPKRDPNGTWRIQYRWKDYTGKSCKSQKRGFRTKKEAEVWYMQFMLQQSDDITMTLSKFWEVYKRYIMIVKSTGIIDTALVRSQNVLNFGYILYLSDMMTQKVNCWQ